MTPLKFVIGFSLLTLSACGQKPAPHKADPSAVALNNQAMALVPYVEDTDSSKKALALLDQATSIDTTYFLGYSNKLMFYYQLKQFDKAIIANNKLIQLRPQAHDLYTRGGLLYEQTGDTISSRPYFTKSLTICDVVLDTMNRKHRDFVFVTTNQAINLVMLNDPAKANQVLKDLYEILADNPEYAREKKYIQSLMNKSKSELVDFLNNPSKYGS